MTPPRELDITAAPPQPTPRERRERLLALSRLTASKDGRELLAMLREELLAAMLGTIGAREDRIAAKLSGQAEYAKDLITRLEGAARALELLGLEREP